MPNNGLKKWFMLQVWRVQQVAQILTLALLAINLSVLIYDKMAWRGGVFSNPYAGILIILLALALAIWTFAIVWDIRLRMWREQMAVLIEKNPFNKERMASKEVVMYSLMWLPMLEHIGRQDPKVKEAAESLRTWISRAAKEDPITMRDVDDILRFIGKDHSDLVRIDQD